LLNAYFGLFAGFVQAFVFAILAVAYINVAVES
jgi:F0F1-type ATP synthase membrane subunit a